VSGALTRHLPVLRYDTGETHCATSVGAWTGQPGQELRRGDGTLLAANPARPGEPALSLSLLGGDRYADGTPTQRDDVIAAGAERGPDRTAASEPPPAAGRVYGHVATGSDARAWLSYWFFYPYNEYRLIGPWLGAGRHQGDWEMVQLRLDPAGERPDLVLYTQHARVVARGWSEVERVGERPVIYVARGCHAAYFTPGRHWTGVWFDRANGRGTAPAQELEVIRDGDGASAWVHWPGRWGATRPGRGLGQRLGIDASSPRGPGHQRQWRDPARLLEDLS
jgi:hypothetical protein